MTMNPQTLSAIRFSVVAGLLIGVLRSLPAYAAVEVSLGAGILASALAFVGLLGLTWVVIRRREYSLLSSAVQLWAAFLLSWTLSGVLTHPIAKEIAPDVTWRVIAIGSGIGLLGSPVAIAITAVVIRLGRFLPGSGKPNPTLAAVAPSGIDSPVA